jgi:hypothetical protein
MDPVSVIHNRMDISGAVTHFRTNAPIGRALKPVAEIRGELPARQDRAARNPIWNSAGTVERFQTPVTAGRGVPGADDFPSHRAYQAIHAYTALERSEEREYVSTVLGIDEYA